MVLERDGNESERLRPHQVNLKGNPPHVVRKAHAFLSLTSSLDDLWDTYKIAKATQEEDKPLVAAHLHAV